MVTLPLPNSFLIKVWIFLILFVLYIYDTRLVFSVNRINFYSNTGFCHVTYSDFLRCEEKVYPTNKMECVRKFYS